MIDPPITSNGLISLKDSSSIVLEGVSISISQGSDTFYFPSLSYNQTKYKIEDNCALILTHYQGKRQLNYSMIYLLLSSLLSSPCFFTSSF